jgi:hypothetical protein
MTDSKEFSTSVNMPTVSMVTLNGFDGNVVIEPSEQINISAKIHGLEGMKPNELEKAQIKVDIKGDTITVFPYYGFKIPMVGKHPVADLILGVPDSARLLVNTMGGTTTIKDRVGAVEVNLNGGELVLEQLSGKLDLSVRVGKARIADSTGKLKVTLWGGEVLIARRNPWAAGQELAIAGPGGQVTIEIPDGSSLTLESTSFLGDITSEINWDKTETKGGVGSYFKGILGAGSAKISISSAKTRIILRKPA